MHLLSFIEGMDFDIFIRGVLVVATGFLVLMGSVYVILATNSGARTGLLLALTGFFGWMAIMGVIWWIYGIGWVGRAPTWHVHEVNRGDLTLAEFDRARELGELIDARIEGDAAGVRPLFEVAEETGEPPELEEWRGMLLANPARGEAQATADAFLVEANEFDSTAEYVAIAAFQTGGKRERTGDTRCTVTEPDSWGNCVRRAGVRLYTTVVQVRHPPNYAVVMVQEVEGRSLVTRPGQPPPLKRADADQPVISVIMVRDLGNERFRPAMVTLFSTAMLGFFSWRLHDRDRREKINRALVAAGR
jgi:hypothetical protein